MKNMIIAATASLALFSAAGAQALVTFEDVQTGGILTDESAGLTDQGFNFASDGFARIADPAFGTPPNANNGTKFYIDGYGGNAGGNTTITRAGGGSFTLTGLDIGLSYYANPTDSVTITGTKVGGGTVSQVFNLTDAFQTIAVTGFGPLTSARISTPNSGATGYVAVDNLGLNAVPEPATWALMIIGFGGLGVRMRAMRGMRNAASV